MRLKAAPTWPTSVLGSAPGAERARRLAGDPAAVLDRRRGPVRARGWGPALLLCLLNVVIRLHALGIPSARGRKLAVHLVDKRALRHQIGDDPHHGARHC